MIVTCASCMTKFSFDESKLPPKGAKVRCSRCQHVFVVVPPTEPKGEEPTEDFESFITSQKEFAEPGPKEPGIPIAKRGGKEEIGFPGEEEEMGFPEDEALFSEKAPATKGGGVTPFEPEVEERKEAKPVRPKRMVKRGKKRLPLFFLLTIFVILLVLGGFYLWTEFGSKVKFTIFLEDPVQTIIALWDQVRGVKQEGLVVGDLNRYDEKIGEFFVSVIEGKVRNQSRFDRKHIKIRVVIFDQNKYKIAEKETICGLNLGLEGLKSLPPDFFKGEMLIQPTQAQEMVVPAGRDAPFMVVFKDLSSQAKEFKVEISDAPNL